MSRSCSRWWRGGAVRALDVRLRVVRALARCAFGLMPAAMALLVGLAGAPAVLAAGTVPLGCLIAFASGWVVVAAESALGSTPAAAPRGGDGGVNTIEAIIPLVLGVLAWAGAITAISRFRGFVRVLGELADLANRDPRWQLPRRALAVVLIVLLVAWGGLMCSFGVAGPAGP